MLCRGDVAASLCNLVCNDMLVYTSCHPGQHLNITGAKWHITPWTNVSGTVKYVKHWHSSVSERRLILMLPKAQASGTLTHGTALIIKHFNKPMCPMHWNVSHLDKNMIFGQRSSARTSLINDFMTGIRIEILENMVSTCPEWFLPVSMMFHSS